MSTPLDPTTFAKAIMLEAADIPPHMTIAQWREVRRAEQRPRRRPAVLRRRRRSR